MAAQFGAKIVPFGVVGEDDILELLLDHEDQMKIPFLREAIEKRTAQIQLRTDAEGKVANQILYFPGLLPKISGCFYYLFGKPIDTAGSMEELMDKQKAHDLNVKSEVESLMAYLKERREHDPYRNAFSRLLYRSIHGFDSQVPTFKL